MTDLEIAHSTPLKNIDEVAASMQIPAEEIEHYGKHIAKLPLHLTRPLTWPDSAH